MGLRTCDACGVLTARYDTLSSICVTHAPTVWRCCDETTVPGGYHGRLVARSLLPRTHGTRRALDYRSGDTRDAPIRSRSPSHACPASQRLCAWRGEAVQHRDLLSWPGPV